MREPQIACTVRTRPDASAIKRGEGGQVAHPLDRAPGPRPVGAQVLPLIQEHGAEEDDPQPGVEDHGPLDRHREGQQPDGEARKRQEPEPGQGQGREPPAPLGLAPMRRLVGSTGEVGPRGGLNHAFTPFSQDGLEPPFGQVRSIRL